MDRQKLFMAAALCAAVPLASSADTSWIIKPAASTSGRMQLFASRADEPRPRTIIVDTPENPKQFKNLRFGDNKKRFSFAGINVHGVAVAFTGAGPSLDPVANKPKSGVRPVTGSYAVGHILRNSKTAKQAVDLIRKSVGRFSGTMIILIADRNQAFIFECSSRHMASYQLGLNYAVYSNVWKLPGMEDASARDPEALASYAHREWIAKTGIRNARKGDRKVSIAEAIAVSRLNVADMKRKGLTSAPSVKNSIDAQIFEIDQKYPALLSCVYVASGPQRHTVYLPVPLAAIDELPPELVNGEWAAIGDETARKTPPETPVSDEIIEFERGLHQEFNDIRFKAAQLLDDGKTEEAKKLLSSTLRRQTQEVMKFMQEHK
ncbi:MAG: hypothetical protein J6Y54_04595 [Lentisphaeria bacterium]|nr:hypothetical protein [Lentisphaeria bacterium]